MKIEVTQQDIEKGKRQSMCNCPIARAIKRKVPRTPIEVGGFAVEVTKDMVIHFLPMPQKAIRFIEKFDSSKKVKPFSFDLPIEPLTQESK